MYLFSIWVNATYFFCLMFGTAITSGEKDAWKLLNGFDAKLLYRERSLMKEVFNYSVTRSFISSLINFTEPPVQTSDPAQCTMSNRSQITWAALLVQQNQWVRALRRKRPSVNENDKTITSAAGSLAESEMDEKEMIRGAREEEETVKYVWHHCFS